MARELPYETGRRRAVNKNELETAREMPQTVVGAEGAVGTGGSRGLFCKCERMSQRSRSLCGNFTRIHTRDSDRAT